MTLKMLKSRTVHKVLRPVQGGISPPRPQGKTELRAPVDRPVPPILCALYMHPVVFTLPPGTLFNTTHKPECWTNFAKHCDLILAKVDRIQPLRPLFPGKMSQQSIQDLLKYFSLDQISQESHRASITSARVLKNLK